MIQVFLLQAVLLMAIQRKKNISALPPVVKSVSELVVTEPLVSQEKTMVPMDKSWFHKGAGEAPVWTSTISGIIISGGEITITGDLFVSNTITGYRISGEFIDAVQEITASSGAFAGTVTGLTVLANTLSGATISGQTVTGTRALFTTGTFQDLFVDDDFIIGDNLTVSGDLEVGGNSVFDSGIVVSGASVFREGITVTGTSNFVSGILIGTNLTVTGTISGTTVTGETATFTTGQFNDLYIDDVFIVGDNLTVSGDLNVSGEVYLQSGINFQGPSFLCFR